MNNKNLVYILLLSQLLLLPGCSKKDKCDLELNHAHIYYNEEGFDKYIDSEELIYNEKWIRTDSSLLLNDDEEKLLEYENNNGLYRIALNRGKIDEITNRLIDHLQYRYEYEETIYNMETLKEETVTCYSWTANPDNKKITGETREAHFMYQGYKIIQNKDGEYETVSSSLKDNIDELLDEGYLYIKDNFYILVNPDTKEVLSYENPDLKTMYEDYKQGIFNPEQIITPNTTNKHKTKSLILK